MISRPLRLVIFTRALPVGLGTLLLGVGAFAQVPSSPTSPKSDELKAKCGDQVRSTYLLGPGDQLEISAPELTELANKQVRVDGEGDIEVPLGGRVHVAGLTAQKTEEELNKVLSTYIRHPQVVVSIAEVRSQPVSVLGAVNTPGVHQVQGHKTLLEMLARDTTGRGIQRPYHSGTGLGLHTLAELAARRFRPVQRR